MRLANTAARAPWVPLWQRTISALGPAQARRQERAAFAHPGSVTAAATETAAYRTGAIGRALGGRAGLYGLTAHRNGSIGPLDACNPI